MECAKRYAQRFLAYFVYFDLPAVVLIFFCFVESCEETSTASSRTIVPIVEVIVPVLVVVLLAVLGIVLVIVIVIVLKRRRING